MENFLKLWKHYFKMWKIYMYIGWFTKAYCKFNKGNLGVE